MLYPTMPRHEVGEMLPQIKVQLLAAQPTAALFQSEGSEQYSQEKVDRYSYWMAARYWLQYDVRE